MIALVDTVVWSIVLRRKTQKLSRAETAVAATLTRLIQADSARLLGTVRQELLSGMREAAQFERLRLLLRSFPDVKIDSEDFEEAAAVHNACRMKGISGSSVDFLI